MQEVFFLEKTDRFSVKKTLNFIVDQINLTTIEGEFDLSELMDSIAKHEDIQEYFYSGKQRLEVDLIHQPFVKHKLAFLSTGVDFSLVYEEDKDFPDGHLSFRSRKPDHAMIDRIQDWIQKKGYHHEEKDQLPTFQVSDSEKKGLTNKEIADKLTSGKWFLNKLGTMYTSKFSMLYLRNSFFYFSLTNESNILHHFQEVKPKDLEAFLNKTQGPTGYKEEFVSPIEDLLPTAVKVCDYIWQADEIMESLKADPDYSYTIMKDWYVFYKPPLVWYAITESDDYSSGYYETAFNDHRIKKEVINTLIRDEKTRPMVGSRGVTDHRQKQINEHITSLFPAGIMSDRLYYKSEDQAFAELNPDLALYFQFRRVVDKSGNYKSELQSIFKTTIKEHRGVILESIQDGVKFTSAPINENESLNREAQKMGFDGISKELLEDLFTLDRIIELVKSRKITLECSANRAVGYRSRDEKTLVSHGRRAGKKIELEGFLKRMLDTGGFVKLLFNGSR